jgi:hypothetical protein
MNGNRDEEAPPDSTLLLRALEDLTRQQAVDALEDPVRRQVLHDLDPEEGPVALSELAERLASPDVRSGAIIPTQPRDAGPTGIDYTERVVIQLHHGHLPKLDDYGLVEYDHREKNVRPIPSQ